MSANAQHRLSTRLWHWVNALAVFILLMSGLTISNAHPRLYWGQYGANSDAAWLILPRFPGWMTIPSTYDLALARAWHLAFAWVFATGLVLFLVRALWTGHIVQNILPRLAELHPNHLMADVRKHLLFDFSGDAWRYNPLQKIAYATILLVILPFLVLTGMTMSPGLNASWPWLLDVFGGRQSARSIHFICAALTGGFIIIHLALVLAAGPVRLLRGMITGQVEDARK